MIRSHFRNILAPVLENGLNEKIQVLASPVRKTCNNLDPVSAWVDEGEILRGFKAKDFHKHCQIFDMPGREGKKPCLGTTESRHWGKCYQERAAGPQRRREDV